MTYTIELLNEHALRLLRELESMRIIRFISRESSSIERKLTPPQKKFNAISIDTLGYKFNREEANER
jgi:hypothetical protein